MLSIIYITCRTIPKFDWFFDSLNNECKREKFDNNKIQIIIIDSILWSDKEQERRNYVNKYVNNRFIYEHHPPKPTPFQGRYRKTKYDFFCAANTRNTGALYAKHPYIAFVDDLSILMPGWLKHVIEAAKHNNYILAGAYSKVNNMIVKNGNFISGNITGIDNRLGMYKQRTCIKGDQLYGASFSIPLKFFLELNGQNELCDTIGGEDYLFGLCISKKGYKIYFEPSMLTYETDDIIEENKITHRIDKVISKDKYFKLCNKYGIDTNKINHNKYDSSHFLLDYVSHTNLTKSDNHGVSLIKLRDDIKNNKSIELPKIDKYFFTDESIYNLNMNNLDKLYNRVDLIYNPPNSHQYEGWCSLEKAKVIIDTVVEKKPNLCVELGCFGGRSLMPFGLGLEYNNNGVIYGIDPWKKEASLEGTNDIENDKWWSKIDYEKMYKYTIQKINENNFDKYIKLIRDNSFNAVNKFENNTIDILHQDSNHSEEITTKEVELWVPKMKKGGLWFADDIDWNTTKKAYNELETKYNFKLIENYKTWAVYQKQ